MNLRVLEYLTAVADTQHFGKAAEKCFVSQPTLSMQIKKLEDYLGVQLFERNNKSVHLTDIGRTIVEHARKLNFAADELKQIAKSAKNPNTGIIKMGVIPTIAPYLLPNIVPKITAQFPDLTLLLKELTTKELLTRIHSGELDLLVLALPINDTALIVQELYTEEFLLAVPKNHELANKKEVTIEQISDEPMLLLEEGHCLRDQALDVCHTNARFTRHHFEATSLETLRQMVSAGVGVTLMPEHARKECDKNIVYIPFKDPAPARKVGIVWRNTTSRGELFEEIKGMVSRL